eukprot:scaffold124598_cov23-Tisochrysis_lutea.AAC.1
MHVTSMHINNAHQFHFQPLQGRAESPGHYSRHCSSKEELARIQCPAVCRLRDMGGGGGGLGMGRGGHGRLGLADASKRALSSRCTWWARCPAVRVCIPSEAQAGTGRCPPPSGPGWRGMHVPLQHHALVSQQSSSCGESADAPSSCVFTPALLLNWAYDGEVDGGIGQPCTNLVVENPSNHEHITMLSLSTTPSTAVQARKGHPSVPGFGKSNKKRIETAENSVYVPRKPRLSAAEEQQAQQQQASTSASPSGGGGSAPFFSAARLNAPGGNWVNVEDNIDE